MPSLVGSEMCIRDSVYPYVITLDIKVTEQKQPKKQMFFEEFPQRLNQWNKFPENPKSRGNYDLVYQYYLNLKPISQINKQKDYFIINKIGGGEFGEVYLVKSTIKPEVYALKRVKFGLKTNQDPKLNEQIYQVQVERFDKFFKTKNINDLDDSNIEGDPNNPLRELKVLLLTQQADHPKKFLKLHKIYLIQEYINNQQIASNKYLYLLMDYFGGIYFSTPQCNGASSIFEYFSTIQDHIDIGFDPITVEKITFNLFSDLLDRVEDLHKLQLGLRDMHDDNILIQRKTNSKFKLRIIDFGLCAKLTQSVSSLKFYQGQSINNQFRDPSITDMQYHQQKYEPVYDFYGFGAFLERITKLYMSPVQNSNYQNAFKFLNADQKFIQYLKVNKTEILKDSSKSYPRSINKLRKSDAYKEWVKERKSY
eukprot:TRINITY_DN22882_c0_g1_i4.p1 TRINITY_DN22882_c0_g1~~TRINITY_DN22882_c0_g1_i4.p1  ORF type:complete len:423 (+),score=76.37 TRINITY_DN22882_c0_g1_i4:109-1377(+)